MSENHIRPWRNIYRRKSRQINVGSVPIGGDAPIAVQTMTNTLTTDVKSTIEQVVAASEAGADLVRVSVPDLESSKALKEIVKESPVPIVADIHFHYKRGIEAAEAGAACLRINPGNIGSEERVKEVIQAAKDNNCSMRIGVNAGSLEKDILDKFKEPCPEALVESALRNNIPVVALESTIITHGMQNIIDDVFYEIQKSNMSKLDNKGKPIYREDGKVLKLSLIHI